MPNGDGAQRFLPLSGEGLTGYSAAFSRLILAGRLNQLFPDPYACASRMQFLSPAVRDGIYDGIRLDRISGLPQLRDILTVQADREIAPAFLAELPPRATTPKLDAKVAYYRRLVDVPMPPLCRLEVKLRRILRERGAASFEVVFDRYDSAEAVFVRYTLLLEQTDAGWGRTALLEREGDYSEQTNLFRQTMERFAQDDSEITFLLLGKVDGIRLEEVTRARIGPLWSPWTPAPPGWLPNGDSSAYVLHLPIDRASVNQEADVDNDPFSARFKDSLSSESRPLVEQAAEALGYKVFKDRKFVCTPSAEAPLRKRLAEAGGKNIVYVA